MTSTEKMKTLFIFILTFFVFSKASGFGLIEYSTVMHTKHRTRQDTLRNNNQQFDVIQTATLLKKEPEKTDNNHFTKSLIQWLANGVKSTVEFITSAFINIGKAILAAIIHIFTSKAVYIIS